MAKDTTSNPPSAARPGQRPPPIIDLAAEEVGRNAGGDSAARPGDAPAAAKAGAAESPASASARSEAKREETRDAPKTAVPHPEEVVIPSAFATASRPPTANTGAAPASRSPGSLLLAAVLGGILAAAAVLFLSGLLAPGPDGAPDLTADVAALEADIAALRQAEPPGPDAALDGRLAALEQSLEELHSLPASGSLDATALADLEGRLAALEQAPGEAPAGADPALLSRFNRLEESVSGLPGEIAALEEQATALADRMTGLQTQAESLQSSVDTANANAERAVALGPAVLADALFDALQSGTPFASELDAMRGLGLDETALDSLAPHAGSGLPTLGALRESFEAAAASVDLTPPPPEGTGTMDRLLQGIGDLVEVRPANPVEGSDPPAILARIRAALDAGDLRAALHERDALPDDAKAATETWAQMAQARLAADEFASKLRSDALSRLGGQG